MSAPLTAPAYLHPCPCRSEHAPPVLWTHRHHIWPLYAGGPDVESNIAYVCPATHDWIHAMLRSFENGSTSRQRGWPNHAYELALRGWELMQA